MNFQLRPAGMDDYWYCYRLTKRNMFELFSRHWGGWDPHEFRKGFIVENINIIMIARRRAGYISVKTGPGWIYIDNIQLSPKVQGRGVGTRILSDLLARHADKCIRLTTFDDNPAMRLYERMGFKVKKREGKTVKMERPVEYELL